MKLDKWDNLFSKYVRLLEGGYCRKCGKYFGLTRGLHCAHWQGRGRWTTRYERDNCTSLCFNCHQKLDHNQEAKDELFFNILGQKRAIEVIELSKKTLKDFGLTKDTVRERIWVDLKERIKLFKEANND